MNLAARHALSLPFFRSALLAALPAALGIALSSTTILAGDRELAFVKGIYEKMRQNFRDPSAPMYLPFREHASPRLHKLFQDAQAATAEGEPLVAYDFFMQGNNWDPSEQLSFSETGPSSVRIAFAGTRNHPRPKGAWVEFDVACHGQNCVIEEIRDPEVGSLVRFLRETARQAKAR